MQVCPTGIDIRKGLQYECIACAACIDACDDVMDKVGSPRGLIRYTTEHAMAGTNAPASRVRRLFVYGALLTLAAGIIAYSLVHPHAADLDVIRDRNALYREVHGDWIENAYTIKVINEDDKAHIYRLQAQGLDHLELATPANPIEVGPGTVSNVAGAAAGARGRCTRACMRSRCESARSTIPGLSRTEKTRFIGPCSL